VKYEKTYDLIGSIAATGGRGLTIDAAMAERLIAIYRRELEVNDSEQSKTLLNRIAELEGIVAGTRKESYWGVNAKR
jgi:hypothetical protein